MNTRRRFIASAGAILLAMARAGRAQPSGLPRVVWVSPTQSTSGSLFADEFRRGMNDAGYREDLTYRLQVYWGDDSPSQLQRIVGEVVASGPDVIVALGIAAPHFKAATRTVPVVFGYSGDPVEAGFVETLARPGRNLTGISFLTLELAGKRIDLAKEMIPGLTQIAILAAPQHPGDQAERRASEAGAARVGVRTVYFEASNPAELSIALDAIARSGCEAAVFFPVQYVMTQRERIAAWSTTHRIPAISGWAQFAEAGNLFTYGPNLRDASARLASYAAKVLRGAKPADLPVELPTRVEFVVNLRAARALGVRIPQTILLRADRVIDG